MCTTQTETHTVMKTHSKSGLKKFFPNVPDMAEKGVFRPVAVESIRYLPVMMLTSSFVIAAWRLRLYCICSEEIMSLTFRCALPMELRLEIQTISKNQSSNVGNEPSTDFTSVSLNESRINSIGK